MPFVAASCFADLIIGGLTSKGNQTPDFYQQFILLIKILSLVIPLTYCMLVTVYFTCVII